MKQVEHAVEDPKAGAGIRERYRPRACGKPLKRFAFLLAEPMHLVTYAVERGTLRGSSAGRRRGADCFLAAPATLQVRPGSTLSGRAILAVVVRRK